MAARRRCCADGLFERFPCDAVFGLHNRPGLPVGQFAIRPGPVMAGAVFFDILVQGRGGHGARPESTVDPVIVGAQIVSALADHRVAQCRRAGFGGDQRDRLHGRRRLQRHPRPRGDEGHGARLQGRDDAPGRGAHARASRNRIAAGFGATAEVRFREIAAPTINTPEEAAAMGDAAAALVGEAHVERNRSPVMGSEDFAYMLLEKPGAYIHVGNGTGDAGGCEVHNPHYDFNDAAIPYGGGMLATLVEQKLARVG